MSDSIVKDKVKDELVFSDNKEFPEEIKEKLREFMKGKTENIVPTQMSSQLKEMLDKNFGSGWCVIVGGHFSGAFTYIGSFYIEITVKDMVILLYKTYKPDKQ